MSDAPKLAYTIDQAAAAIGISRAQVYRLIKSGDLEKFTWAGRTLILAEVIQTALARASGRRAA